MLRGMTVASGLSLGCCLPAGLRRMKASRGRKQVTRRMTRELLSGARTSGWDYGTVRNRLGGRSTAQKGIRQCGRTGKGRDSGGGHDRALQTEDA